MRLWTLHPRYLDAQGWSRFGVKRYSPGLYSAGTRRVIADIRS